MLTRKDMAKLMAKAVHELSFAAQSLFQLETTPIIDLPEPQRFVIAGELGWPAFAEASYVATAVGEGGLPAHHSRGQLLVWRDEGKVEVNFGLRHFWGVARSAQGIVNHVGASEHLSLPHQEPRANDAAVGGADAGYG